MESTTAHTKFSPKRLLWIPIFALIVFALPDADPVTEASLLRESSAFDGLFAGIDGELASFAADVGRTVEPTSWQLFQSWLGQDPGLTVGPADRAVFVLDSVDDRSLDGLGLSEDELQRRRWTPETVVAHPKVSGLGFVTVTTEAPTDIAAPRVRLVVTRSDDGTITSELKMLRRGQVAGVDPPLVVQNDEGWIDQTKLSFEWQSVSKPASRYSVLPPLVAICLALVMRSALISLLGAVLVGGFVLASLGGDSNGVSQFVSLYSGQITDEFRITIVLFVLFLIGMIGVITRVGGIQAIVNFLVRGAEGARKTRITTVVMGLVIFFDDYSNSVVVGSAMRPLTDKLKIAREKLAYLIDSTAAPIAGIALFSTWIGYEVSQYQVALEVVDPEMAKSAYSVFLQTIPLRFYCLFTLGFVLMNVIFSRDFGPMLKAETRAAKTGQVIREGARPLTSSRFATLSVPDGVVPRMHTAVIPLAFVIFAMVFGFWFVGGGVTAFMEQGITSLGFEGIGNTLANDYNMHVAAVAAGLGSLIALVIARKHIGLPVALRAWSIGLSSLLFAVAILVSAWALAEACGQLRAGEYLVASVGENVPLMIQPVVFFVLACLIAFATGTSWGTMAILIPIAIPLVYYTEGLVPGTPLAGTVTLLSFGAVLEGAIFGDHCSPISDTTVLSSVAAGSDHIDHVKTQAPYALTTMLIALLFGYLPVAMGWYTWHLAIPLGLAACAAVLLLFGKRIPDAAAGVSDVA